MEKAEHKIVRVGRIHRQFREALLIVGFVCFTMMIAVGAVALARYLVTRKNLLDISVSDIFETQTTTQTTDLHDMYISIEVR
ncbi:unnamed protein product [Adineta steineri]|uniref:Uncharacterized protein n=1 Tax=Adineta steineri TaxID=433720 RepID=A0A819IUK7_9BILA|nr:unnamed protein product [Adineta steineri]CAF3956823.1 unnamed protein product [Adineta steineri]CAF4021157.1 unnamed protein product [Adineta steineri]